MLITSGWAHQYVQQTNQPWARNFTANPFFNVVSYSTTYGLEPNFPCCTVNHAQGYPKYVASSYARRGHDGVVHALLGPTTIDTQIHDKRVKIACNTKYPFNGKFTYTITTETNFDFFVRVPTWATNSTKSSYRVGDGKRHDLSPNKDDLQHFAVRKGRTTIEVNLAMTPRVDKARTGSVAIYYGPLLYALDIQYSNLTSHAPLNWTDRNPLPIAQVMMETKDWILNPTSEWRYAINPDSVTVEELHSSDKDLPNPIWARDATPVALWVDGWVIDWEETYGTAALPPVSPEVSGKPTKVRLIPYGAAKLRIAEFPVAQKSTT